MDLITPEIGLVFWTTLSFAIVWFILGKYAWKPALKAIKDRESTIENSLKQAEEARAEMANLNAENEKILRDARAERDVMLTEARETKDAIVGEAKGKAKEEGDRMIETAREAIKNEKLAAQTEIKNMVAQLSIEIAEKIVRHELDDEAKQKALVSNLIDEVTLN
jgi:F-type H+-transporting ATPase subunit b